MKVIYARSPYTISINETGQVGSKLELRIWYNKDTKPTLPTYTFSKQIPSITQTETYYNISPYIKDFIVNINPETTLLIDTEEVEMYCLVEVITFYTEDLIDYTEIETLDFVGVNGFTNPNLGANQATIESVIYLTNPTIDVLTNDLETTFSSSQNVPYFNVLVEWEAVATKELQYIYKDLLGGNTSTQVILTDADDAGIYNFKVPYRLNGSAYENGNTVQVVDTSRGGGVAPLPTITYETVCEPKYTPVRCDFINRQGGWQTIVFFKAQTNNFDFKSSEFKVLPSNWDYNPKEGGMKSFNFEAMQTVKLNTGWVDENYINFIFDLMASETVLLDGIPAQLKSKSLPYKTGLKDHNINYEIDFEYTYNLINNVQ
jgi:hypothetical protein